MAKTANDVFAKRIEIVDQPEEVDEERGLNLWLILSVVFIAATITFIVVRRFLNSSESE